MYKSVRIDLRVSPREAEILDKVRGNLTRSAWLRNQIHKANEPWAKKEAPEPEPPPVTPAPTPPATLVTKNTQTHYHRRGVRLDPPRWVQGQPVYSYRCSFEGCDHIME